MDHDQRFKILIQMFFLEFPELFFKDWADRLEASAVEWLDKEVFLDPPDGHRRVLDLVGKMPTKKGVPGQRHGDPELWMALVHIEIESPDSVAPSRSEMFEAYVQLRRQHKLPVLPIGIFLRVGLDGVGIDVYEENFWEFQPVLFRYLYVGLPALDAVEYVQGQNWLGVALAALMRIPKDRVGWLGAEALRRLQAAPLTDQQRFLLGDCVQAYLPLDEAQQAEFERLVTSEPYQGVKAMNKTSFDKGLEAGIEKGIEKGRRAVVREMLEEGFGPLSQSTTTKLEQLPPERLREIQRAIRLARSLKELGLED